MVNNLCIYITVDKQYQVQVFNIYYIINYILDYQYIYIYHE